jgi:hypothetical protein
LELLLKNYFKMELAIGYLSIPSEMGRPYRVLRSLKPLLFQTPEDIAKCPALGDVLPHSLALALLFSFGPKEMLSPHEVNLTTSYLLHQIIEPFLCRVPDGLSSFIRNGLTRTRVSGIDWN